MATPLLLVVHGRTGGVIPTVYRQLAQELERRRQGPVGLLALTAPASGEDLDLWGPALTLVPLLLLPGNHARVDVPALARQLGPGPAAAVATKRSDTALLAAGEGLEEPGAGQGHGPGASPAASGAMAADEVVGTGGDHGAGGGRKHGVGSETAPAPGPRLRRLPFLGAWPAWQSALAAELAALSDPAGSGGRTPAQPPLLLHHPLAGGLGSRYLEHLQRSLHCRCLAAQYSSQDSEAPALAIDGPVLPLALAANRLTERLEPQLGRSQAAPLLERPRLRQVLIELLAALP